MRTKIVIVYNKGSTKGISQSLHSPVESQNLLEEMLSTQ